MTTKSSEGTLLILRAWQQLALANLLLLLAMMYFLLSLSSAHILIFKLLVFQVFQGTDEQLQEMYENHQLTVKKKEKKLTECQRDLERAGRECQRMNHLKSDLLVEQGK